MGSAGRITAAAEPARLAPLPDRLLKLGQVMEIAGLGKTMIYRLIRAGAFPQPHKPGGFASRWSEAEVRAWRATVDEERRQRAA